ncbi:MAG: GNAT family N-acetyltransferase [bacterium]
MAKLGYDIGIRRAKPSDSHKVWKWRNSPLVRSMSFSAKEIPWEIHKKWFNERLTSKNSYLYIAYIDNEDNTDDVGIIRFEVKGVSAEVSIFLSPSYIRKGLGFQIIMLGTEQFVIDSGIRRIIALIKESNIASVRSFEKAGYRFNSRTGNGDILVYVWEMI